MLLRSKDLSHCPMEYYSIVWDVSITTVYGGMLFRIMMHIPQRNITMQLIQRLSQKNYHNLEEGCYYNFSFVLRALLIVEYYSEEMLYCLTTLYMSDTTFFSFFVLRAVCQKEYYSVLVFVPQDITIFFLSFIRSSTELQVIAGELPVTRSTLLRLLNFGLVYIVRCLFYIYLFKL